MGVVARMNQSRPLLGAALAEDLANNRAAESDRPTADATLLRGSDAYRCARQIAFGALKIPRAPFSTDTLAAFDAGQQHHIRLQGLLASRFGAQLEVPCSYKDLGIDVSGHADAVYTHPGDPTVNWLIKPADLAVEIKSMKTYPFVRSAGGADRYGRHVDPEGPKLDHMIQGGIYAASPQIDAAGVHIVYLNKEDGRIAEWLVPLDDEPVGPDREDLRTLVCAELDRLSSLGDDIRNGFLPWRTVPGFGLVRDPLAAKGTDDFFWGCGYCGWQDLCASLPPSKTPVTQIELVGMGDDEAF